MAHVMSMPADAFELALRLNLRHIEGIDANPLFLQERVGQNGASFIIHKYRTLDSVTGQPLTRFAKLMREYGPDELAQYHNILADEMSVVGHRAVLPEIHEAVRGNAPGKLVDRWDRVVAPTPVGILSTFAIKYHKGNAAAMIEHAEERLENDIKDVKDASFVHDVRLILRAVRASAMSQL